MRLRLQQLRRSTSFLERADFDAVFPQYLFLTFCIARASVPLMRTALERLRAIERPRTLVRRYGEYLEQHIAEERDHDEWLLQDLRAVGWTRAECLRRPVPAVIASGVGAQYYWIQHSDPVSLLGYMAVLEGSIPSQAEVTNLRESSRHPRAAFRSLLHHARVDGSHAESVFEVIDRLPLDTYRVRVLDQSFVHTAQWLAHVGAELVR